MTIPPVTSYLAPAGPQRVQPQLLEDSHAAVQVVVAADEDGVAGQHQRGGSGQGANQRRDVIADRIRGPGRHLGLDDGDDVAQYHFELLLEDLPDLGIGVAGGVTGHHDRVIVRVHGGGTSDHSLGELLYRLAGLAGGEILREFFEFFGDLGQDLSQHGVLGVEVEVEAGSSHPGALADRADRQFGERLFLQQLTHRGA